VVADQIVVVTIASHLKRFGVADVIDALPAELRTLHRIAIELDTLPFHDDSDAGDWSAEDRYVRSEAARVTEACRAAGIRGCYVFALAEVPSLVAFGTYLADRVAVTFIDWDRDGGSWRWPAANGVLSLQSIGVPAELVHSADPVVIRIELSSTISDEQLAPVVGDARAADIQIRPQAPEISKIGLVRSPLDLLSVRAAVRAAVGAVGAFRPLAQEIHLFIAAPCSVCITAGQELQIRNLRGVQTYRFRPGREAEDYTEAILLREWPSDEPVAVSEEDSRTARRILAEVWSVALDDVRDLARQFQQENPDSSDWRASLRHIPILAQLPHLESLPPLFRHVQIDRDRVDLSPHSAREYSFDPEDRAWRFRDDTVLGLWEASGRDSDRAVRGAQLFLFHEYLHDYHGLTKLAAVEVGSFPNVLERIDHVADLFAVSHDLELATRRGMVRNDEAARNHVAGSIELILRSIGAFQGRYPLDRIQERALRRLLNWHWRLAQVRRASSLEMALRVLSRQPAIEISGLVHSSGARRVYVRLDRFDSGTGLAIGLVDEKGRFDRIAHQPAVDIRELVNGIGSGDHAAVQLIVAAVFEQVRTTALPSHM
jgi:hypothetical protein